jgi:ribosomal protein S18 acetylase RimI-like enzyme
VTTQIKTASDEPAIRLRTADPSDRDFLHSVYASTRATELAPTNWTDEQKTAFTRMQYEAQDRYYHDVYDRASHDVILVDGEPAGRLSVDRGPTETCIIDISLSPGFRGRGLGTRLLQALQAETAAVGSRLTIHVEKLNPALRLYERLGFQITEDRGVYWLLRWNPPPRGADAA